MKIILNEYVPNLGDAGERVTVAGGYARNYLFPKRLAFEATAENVKTFENNLKQKARKLVKFHGEAEAKKAQLEALGSLEFTRKSGEQGKLFGSVTSSDLGEALVAKGFDIDKRRIVLNNPIKSLGETSVEIKLHPKVTAVVKVVVLAEAPEPDARELEDQAMAAQEEQAAAGPDDTVPADQDNENQEA
ncbi:MAG: 50S ribosomal protein L9 [Nitrospinota bacterium]|nr:50S ribosomal protein L9 [Nitrospinota bacterium]